MSLESESTQPIEVMTTGPGDRLKFGSGFMRYLSWMAALLAAGLYAWQSWLAIHTLRSPLDEGSFVVKGLAFANGQFAPYQPYSFWLNKMPLSFLIPGWVLKLFEPGIVSTRYFALIVSLLFLLGLFLLLRRESNLFLAVAGLWVFALNPILIKTFATANSQGLAACILVWSFYFFFGKKRRTWQIAAGAFLAAILVMTRENLLPVLVYFWVYIFVCYRKSFWWGITASLLPLVFIHALYFPRIFVNWFSWVPFSGLRAALYRLLQLDQLRDHRFIKGDLLLFSRLTAFMEGIRINLVIFLDLIVAFFAFLGNKERRRRFDFLSLLTLFLVLVGMHTWASVGKDYCIYCFQNYLSFFNVLGLLLAAIAFNDNGLQKLKKPFGIVFSTLAVSGLAIIFSSYKEFYKTTLNEWLYANVWKFSLPRIDGFRLMEGTTTLKAMLINKFGWEVDVALKVIYPIFTLTLLIALVISIAGLIFWLSQRRLASTTPNIFWNRAVLAIMIVVLVLSPTLLVGNTTFAYQCQNDVFASLELAGQNLRALIPAGATIDWRATNASILLLKLPDVIYYPPQLNSYYSYIDNPLSDLALKNGRWTPQLSRLWLKTSDYLVLDSHTKVQPDDVQLDDYFTAIGDEIALYACGNETFRIRVFKKKP